MMKILTSRSNPVFVHMKKLGGSKKYRDEQGLFLCDGFKLLKEAINCGVFIDTVIASQAVEVDLPENTKVYKAKEDLIDSISPLKNSQGLLFSSRMDKRSDVDFLTGTHVLLDNIQDPGNVGAIVRCANAFGIKSVILTDKSADLYNPKTIRGSMGAIFRQTVLRMNKKEIAVLKKSGVSFIGAVNDDDSIGVNKANLTDTIIIFGNEGQGISEMLSELCENKVKIPLSPESESINVSTAAAIIMWEAAGRR